MHTIANQGYGFAMSDIISPLQADQSEISAITGSSSSGLVSAILIGAPYVAVRYVVVNWYVTALMFSVDMSGSPST